MEKLLIKLKRWFLWIYPWIAVILDIFMYCFIFSFTLTLSTIITSELNFNGIMELMNILGCVWFSLQLTNLLKFKIEK